MKVYKVKLWFRGSHTFEVEANGYESAEGNAIDMLQEACGSILIDVDDATVLLSDNQYTAQQELFDRERNINEDDPKEDR
jgi:hypothetical protein